MADEEHCCPKRIIILSARTKTFETRARERSFVHRLRTTKSYVIEPRVCRITILPIKKTETLGFPTLKQCTSSTFFFFFWSTEAVYSNFSKRCRLTQFFLRDRCTRVRYHHVRYLYKQRPPTSPSSNLHARHLKSVPSRRRCMLQAAGEWPERGLRSRSRKCSKGDACFYFRHLSDRDELGREEKQKVTSRYVLSHSRSFCRPRMAMETGPERAYFIRLWTLLGGSNAWSSCDSRYKLRLTHEIVRANETSNASVFLS